MQERMCDKEGCTHDCSTCPSAKNAAGPESLVAPLNAGSSVKYVIGVISGKGGVGKSLVTSMLAVLMSRMDKKVAILDADVTGPSIPKMFGIDKKAVGTPEGIKPAETEGGIKLMSINLLLEEPEQPVVWRGPVISGAVKQFWTDVHWGDIDYMFIDMPPGTGDVPLTVFQSIPLDGVIIVTSPQDLVSLIVKKAYNMANMMNVPVIGIVENMSYAVCPDCGRKIEIFGHSRIAELADELAVLLLGRIPIDPTLAMLADRGEFEGFMNDALRGAADALATLG